MPLSLPCLALLYNLLTCSGPFPNMASKALQSLALSVYTACFLPWPLALCSLGPNPCFSAHSLVPLQWLFCLDPLYLFLDRSIFRCLSLSDASKEAAFTLFTSLHHPRSSPRTLPAVPVSLCNSHIEFLSSWSSDIIAIKQHKLLGEDVYDEPFSKFIWCQHSREASCSKEVAGAGLNSEPVFLTGRVTLKQLLPVAVLEFL